MYLSFLKSKIHTAKVSECDLHYEGSISIDLIMWKSWNI